MKRKFPQLLRIDSDIEIQSNAKGSVDSFTLPLLRTTVSSREKKRDIPAESYHKSEKKDKNIVSSEFRFESSDS